MRIRSIILIPFLALLTAGQATAADIAVAVASNFSEAIKALAADFEEDTGHKIKLIFGSTGRHYAQIRNGAPFDVFFAADSKRPALLEEEGVSVSGSRFTYAEGKLVLWSPQQGRVDQEAAVLKQGEFQFLAMANPKLAPYGAAAEQVLRARGLWKSLRSRIVQGENVGQAFQFVDSQNADLGFVALSQVSTKKNGSLWHVPQSLYSPILQQAVLLKDQPEARQFLQYVQSASAKAIIETHGYGIP